MTEETLESPQKEPLFNVPPLTLGLAVILILIHTIRVFSPAFDDFAVVYGVFIPELFDKFPLLSFYRLLSYALLHIGLLHLAMNSGGLLAFGSGIEKIMGKGWWVFIMLGGCICGALIHWVLFPHSVIPMAGASAGLSAFFGALMPLLSRSRKSLARMTALFILINIAFGLVGVGQQPGSQIAWQAHVAGFLFGLAAGGAFIKKAKKRIVDRATSV
jgi:membrane associated rhomboid family serine protease